MIEAYRSKLYPFVWYCRHYNLPDDINAITTTHIGEFLVYLRDNPTRFGRNSTLSRKPVNNTTVQKYCRVVSSFWNWFIQEELTVENPLTRIKMPKAEKKVIKGLMPSEMHGLRFAVIFLIEEPLYKKQVETNLFRLQSELGKELPKVSSSSDAREMIQLKALLN